MGETFYIKESDTAPELEATLEDGSGSPIDLTGGAVDFRMYEPRNGDTVVDEDATIRDKEGGVVGYVWQDGDTDTAGRYRAEFVVTYPDGSVETFPNAGYYDIIITE